MDEFDSKINRWLREVTEQCHEYALTSDLDFYAFQTCIVSNPDILILGINPGGDCKYSKYLSENNVTKRSPDSIHYQENLLVEGAKDWKDGMQSIRHKFKEIFFDDQLFDSLQNAVMMNAIYFNTITSSELKALSKEIESYCIEKTKEMIEMLNPKNILIFSSDKSLLRKIGVSEFKQVSRIIKSGQLNNRLIISVPHFSARGYNSKEIRNEIGNELKKLLIFK